MVIWWWLAADADFDDRVDEQLDELFSPLLSAVVPTKPPPHPPLLPLLLLCDSCPWFLLDDCDDVVAAIANTPGPSSETDRRAHDSNNECSGMIPSERALLPIAELELVNRAGVDWDSSWATTIVVKPIHVGIFEDVHTDADNGRDVWMCGLQFYWNGTKMEERKIKIKSEQFI